MAFSSKLSPMNDCCPVCRQRQRKGRTILKSAYGNGMQICSVCYERCYQNKQDKIRNIAFQDDPGNPIVGLRPAECLEDDPLFRKKEPACGYEFPLSHILAEQTIRNVIFWCSFCIFMRIMLRLDFSGDISQNLSWKAVQIIIMGGSALWAFSFFCQLIQGLFCGMGHTRRMILLAGILVIALLVRILC